MTSFKKESHLRSLLKGITWRLVATLDTFLIVYIVTWIIDGEPSIETGIKIAGVEFLLKFLIYYLHERGWQYIWKDKNITRKDTLYKTISWRFIATLTTFIISGTVLNSFSGAALAIAIVEVFTKFILYYGHERIWESLPRGTIRKTISNSE